MSAQLILTGRLQPERGGRPLSLRIFAKAMFIAGVGLAALVQAATGDFADIPQLKSRVTDTSATLNAVQISRIDAELREFELKKGSQLVVLIVPTTQPEAIEQYSLRVAEAWKIGRKGVSDGVILLVAKNDRKMRIEVGYGLEGALPDAIAKRIIAETISPLFKAGDFAGGILAGVKQIRTVAEGEPLPVPKKSAWASSSGSLDIMDMLFIGVFVAIGLGGFLRAVVGRFMGASLTGGGLGFILWMISGALGIAVIAGVVAFILVLLTGGGRGGGGGGGFSSGGDSGWSSSSSDSFSGGGGDFGGGGASGDW